jgi:hypothetical protein
VVVSSLLRTAPLKDVGCLTACLSLSLGLNLWASQQLGSRNLKFLKFGIAVFILKLPAAYTAVLERVGLDCQRHGNNVCVWLRTACRWFVELGRAESSVRQHTCRHRK